LFDRQHRDDLPWDLGDDTELADKQSMLVVGRPSLDNSDLLLVSKCFPQSSDGQTKTSPNFSISFIDIEDALKILDSLVEVFLGSENTTDGIHCWDRSWA
jgi:hypothetical protein